MTDSSAAVRALNVAMLWRQKPPRPFAATRLRPRLPWAMSTRGTAHLVTRGTALWDAGRIVALGVVFRCRDSSQNFTLVRDTEDAVVICERCLRVGTSPCVYHCWGGDGALLYVGSTKDRYGRFEGHRRTSEWWPLLGRVSFEDFPTLAEARAAEILAIRSEHPTFNKTYRLAASVVASATTGSATFAVIGTVAIFLEAVLLVGLLGIGAR